MHIPARSLPNMLVDAGVKYVILGHSERRELLCVRPMLTVNKKMKKAFEHGHDSDHVLRRVS